MFVLFEENGVFKTGTILADNNASLQVETSHGKRVKLKRNQILLEFRDPSPTQLLEQAEHDTQAIEADFLWEVSPDQEFAFTELAAEYFGHPPSALEATALLLCLHASPTHFHRKGRGRFRKAPPEILQAALAGLERKRLQGEAMERMRGELLARRLPQELSTLLPQLLYRPDRNRIEVKALEAACVDSGLSAPRLLLECGALSSSYDYHYKRFLFEHFPEGTDFPAFEVTADFSALPLADVRAFSIDDATTTEIDDAFSVSPREEGGWRIGIHIAAPALGFSRGSALDEIARRRLSTVYMPGNKITMLPDEVINSFTLAQGKARPVLSLYLEVSPALAVLRQESRIERVPIAVNLRLQEIEAPFNAYALNHEGPDFPWKQELTLLWDLATILEAGRGKPGANQNQTDYSFYVDWDRQTDDGAGHISIEQRQRGAPLDKLVAELMILVNATWGKLLDEAGVPGLYRVQNGGKVRMSTVAEPHDTLGVDCYAWSSSPLRRYVDLLNQWQLIAVLRQNEPVFPPKSPDLFAALRDFEATYAAYAEFQRQMERFWCLRWLRQHGLETIEAISLHDNVVRLLGLPLVTKVSSLPPLVPGSRIQLSIRSSELLDLDLQTRYLETLAEPDQDDVVEPDFAAN